MAAAKKLHHLNAWEHTPRAPKPAALPSGLPGLDELLPGGGWPRAGLVEIESPGEYAHPEDLLLPRLAQPGPRWLGLVAPPYLPRTRLLGDPAIDPSRVQQVNPHAGHSDLWTMERMLRSGDYAVVLGWPTRDTELAARQLRQAALAGNALGVLFHDGRHAHTCTGGSICLRVELSEAGRLAGRLDRNGGSRAQVEIAARR